MRIFKTVRLSTALAALVMTLFIGCLSKPTPPPPPALIYRGAPAQQLPLVRFDSVDYPAYPQFAHDLVPAAPKTITGSDLTQVIETPDRTVVRVGLRAPAHGRMTVTLIDGKTSTVRAKEIRASDGTIHEFTFDGKPGHRTLAVAFNGEEWSEATDALAATAQEIAVVAGERFTPGSPASIRVFVNGLSSSGTLGLNDAKIDVLLKKNVLFSGTTGGDGSVACAFTVPDLAEGEHALTIRAASRVATCEQSLPIGVKNEHRILLVTDKPLYQPGQEIHLRAIALNQFDLRPLARKELLFEIEDAKANKVFKRKVTTSEFGVGHCTFQLADEVAMGDYKIAVSHGKIRSDKTVTVKRYVLPRFEIAVNVEKRFFMPRETIKGTIETKYLFGKPVAGGTIEIAASTFDIEFKQFAVVRPGKTDADGKAEFEVQLPDHLVGQPLEKGDALVKLDIAVTDTADHPEKKTVTFPVVNQPIRITAVAESGRLVPDVENTIYILATYPDGAPAAVEFECGIPERTIKGSTDAKTGFATVAILPKKSLFRAGEHIANTGIFTPNGAWYPQQHYQSQVLDVTVTARDAKGATATRKIELTTDPARDNMLLRLDKAVYTGGETIDMTILTAGNSGTAYVDIIKNRQTILTRSVDIVRGRAAAQWTIPPDLFGTLEVHAYQLLGSSGTFMRDTRVIYVHPASELKIAVNPEKPEYRPRNASSQNPFGAETFIKFHVTDQSGNPVKSALGVIIVDAAVYALQEMQPGLEKVYFTLEEELRNPRYELKDAPLTLPQVLKEREQIETARQEIAKAILANVDPMTQPTGVAAGGSVPTTALQYLYHYFQSWNQSSNYTKFVKRGLRIDFSDETKTAIVNYAKNFDANLTYEKIMRYMPYFKPENMARMVFERARYHRWIDLVNGQQPLFEAGTLRFRAEIARAAITDPFGVTHTVEEFAKSDPAYAPANLAKAVLNARKQAIVTQIWSVVNDPATLLTDDRSAIRSDALASMHLPEYLRTDASGKPIRLDAIMALDDLKKILASKQWYAINGAIAQYLNGRSNLYDRDKGMYVLPDDILEICVRERLLTEGLLRDPWEKPVRFVKTDGPRINNHYGYNFNGFVTIAGPDRSYGTSDDIVAPAYYYANPGHPMAAMRDGGWAGRFQDNYGGVSKYAMALSTGYDKPAAEASDIGGLKRESKEEKPPHAGEVKPLFVREWFPETLLFAPEIVTDDRGDATINLAIADSITTWKLSASASSLTGKLGAAAADIRVFQDFFIEPDLPVALTQDDEISIPIAVYNYLPQTQRIRLVFEAVGDQWFEAMDDAEKIVEVGVNEVRAIYFRIKARKIGDAQTLQVTAYGTKMSDAVKKSIRVEPNGKMFEIVKNDRLTNASLDLDIPPNAIEGGSKILVKVYPGIYTQVLEGVDGILNAPHG